MTQTSDRPTAPPNIVWIMADQHRADVLGCAGDPVVATPHLDRLAAEGVRFSRVSCQGPLCMPARASLLTERYVRDHGVYSNWAEVDLDLPTQPRAMRDAGYHTVSIGKTHLSLHSERGRAGAAGIVDRLHRAGFDEVCETGDKFDIDPANRYLAHLAERGLLDTYVEHMAARSYHGEAEDGQGATQSVPTWDATPMPLPVEDYVDVWHGAEAARWIERHEGDDPFFLFVGFPGPHDPWDAPADAVARYADVEVPLPRSTRRPDPAPLGAYGQLVAGMLDLSCSRSMDEAAIVGMRRAYWAAVTLIDGAVGRIVDALAATGRLDDTWIAYTSDHGEMGGDHGLLSKCLFYEPAVRVPLVLRPPGGAAPDVAGRVVDDLVEHVDLPATFRAIAGAELAGSAGRSLLHHLGAGSAPAEGPRTHTVSENWTFAAFETDRHKLVVDEDRGVAVQLFDLAADPTEDDDLARRPEHRDTLDELMATLAAPFLRTPPQRPHPSPFA